MNPHPPLDLPRAKVRHRKFFAPIWIIPVVAAVAAAWLVYANVKEAGPLITIIFENGEGLQPNQTILKYHGVRVGEVRSVRLAKDLEHVVVQARLRSFASALARDGSRFWIVRPEVSSAGLHGLETIVSGPYIQAQPGNGGPQKQFAGLTEPPITFNTNGQFELAVTTSQINTLSSGSPVYYRGIEVGKVAYLLLNDDARSVKVHLLIQTNYAPLIRSNTKFWNAGGISVRLKLLGINMSAENFKSLIIGGIAFATPDEPGSPVPSGSVFPLNEKADNEWLSWSPSIPITNPETGGKNANTAPAMLLNEVDASGK